LLLNRAVRIQLQPHRGQRAGWLYHT
jgi:hypothetical protein